MSSDAVIYVFVALFGLCFGSFYNVVILRGLSNESIVFPASKCPKCETPLKWWHNIPILSYVLLRGQCAFCKCRISIQYPLIELVTMLLFLLAYLRWDWDVKTLFAIGYFSMFLITAVTDLRERVILTRHAYVLAIMGLGYAVYSQLQLVNIEHLLAYPVVSSVLGMIVGIVVMELMAYTGYLFVKQRAFGEGDSYITGALGAIFGLKMILPVLLLGAVIQLSVSIPMYLYNQFKQGRIKTVVEFVLFLVMATGMWFWGVQLERLIYGCGFLLMVLLALDLIRNLVKDMKTPTQQTFLPYVPALVVAGSIVLYLGF